MSDATDLELSGAEAVKDWPPLSEDQLRVIDAAINGASVDEADAA